MSKVKVKVQDAEGLELPKYATEGSAGFDLIARNLKIVYDGIKEINMDKLAYTVHKGYFVLRPFERALVGTGLFLELPEGSELDIRPRSGLSLKRGITVVNSPGTIDSDYRGEICVIIMNNTKYLSRINFGEAIAQGVLLNYDTAEWEIVKSVSKTERGEGGFGHTDLKQVENAGN